MYSFPFRATFAFGLPCTYVALSLLLFVLGVRFDLSYLNSYNLHNTLLHASARTVIAKNMDLPCAQGSCSVEGGRVSEGGMLGSETLPPSALLSSETPLAMKSITPVPLPRLRLPGPGVDTAGPRRDGSR